MDKNSTENDKLYIENFGPLKKIDIKLNRTNVFIGENGSGKSVLAKIITIVLDIRNHIITKETLFDKFNEFNINFITKDTLIKFEVDGYSLFEFRNEKITTFKGFHEVHKIQFESNRQKFIDNEKLTTQYIPAERNLISLFSKSLSTFVLNDIPLPKFLLHFSSEYEKARQEIPELYFLDMKYVNKGRDLIYYSDDEYLDLEHSSSGIQSSLPLYLTIKYFSKKHRSIVIEEPEQNLFPKAQTDTIKYIMKQVSEYNKLFIMTHSPYILSALNILLYANKVGNINDESKQKVQKIVDKDIWIDNDKFSAYYLENGIARDIKSSRGLISDNEIDDISEDIANELDELLEIYKSCKNG